MIKEKAYAKINLGLHVVGKREDGYHELDMIMTPLELADELIFEVLDKKTIKLLIEGKLDIPTEENIVYKAAIILQQKYNVSKGAKIKLVKNIPVQAGLGGGSADAAATLRGLNQLWELNLTLQELSIIAEELGSDVPFCIFNQTARVQGRGEILTFFADMPRAEVLLLQPGFSCSTKEIFSGVRQKIQSGSKVDLLIDAIKKKDINLVSDCIFNDLEIALRNISTQNYREIQAIKEVFKKAGAIGAVMTGSGSVVYALVHSNKYAQKVKQIFENKNKEKFQVTQGMQIPYTLIQTRIKSEVKSVQTQPVVKEQFTSIKRISDKIIVKAYGWIPLLKISLNKQSIEEVITPIHQYDSIEVYKIEQKQIIIQDNDNEDSSYLQENLSKVLTHLNTNYGLEIYVKRNIQAGYGIVDNNVYLAAILSNSLELFQVEPIKLFQLFDTRVKKYMFQTTTEVGNKVSPVAQIPMSYVVIAKTNIPPIQFNGKELKQKHDVYKKQQLIRGLKNQNFYQVIGSMYTENTRAIYKHIKEDSYNRYKLFDLERLQKVHHANQFMFSDDGTSVYFFLKSQKDAKELSEHLKKEKYIRFSDCFSFKSETKHKPLVSNVLKVVEEVTKEIVKPDLVIEQEKKTYDLSKFIGRDNKNTEGILYIHSPGSLFKQYDFEDLAYYFFENFHDKTIYLNIDNNQIPIYFHMDNLGHIFGLHIIDETLYKGRKGAYALLSGSITQKELKNKLDKNKYDTILQKTQSTVLILNDLFANQNMSKIHALSAEHIKKSGSKMDNLKYAICRRIADRKQDELNMLGIGYEASQDRYFFLTSFTWAPDKHIGNYTFLNVSVKANNYR